MHTSSPRISLIFCHKSISSNTLESRKNSYSDQHHWCRYFIVYKYLYTQPIKSVEKQDVLGPYTKSCYESFQTWKFSLNPVVGWNFKCLPEKKKDKAFHDNYFTRLLSFTPGNKFNFKSDPCHVLISDNLFTACLQSRCQVACHHGFSFFNSNSLQKPFGLWR